jgi:hypothetical protein
VTAGFGREQKNLDTVLLKKMQEIPNFPVIKSFTLDGWSNIVYFRKSEVNTDTLKKNL